MNTSFKNYVISIMVIFCTLNVYSQDVRCNELLTFVKKEGKKKGSVNAMQLINSSWLKSVACYEVDGNLAVIANIKTNEYSLYGKEYIFCGIPLSNWNAFYNGLYAIGTSYGERFHKYIYKYKCDCD
ncbi:hypothetical protein [Bizionia sp. M204]|uniref:hypothetical protein n=1 Tax=Bizionia sp. M204 TaxID=2675331 RepID=UPI00206BB994|nr:hypothetical protein [Bizionia sp. M204]UPS91402.1 hypothetical protein GMA17_06540 [Bizionia sp. M204]